MIDIKLLEKSGETYFKEYKESLEARGADTSILVEILELNRQRKEIITHAETEKSRQNKVSQEVAQLKRQGKGADDLIKEMSQLSQQVKALEARAQEKDQMVRNLLLTIPNKLNLGVPRGSTAAENRQVKSWGTPKSFSFKAKEHGDLGVGLDILDFDRAGKVTGARFSFLKGDGARLERALIQFMMDRHSQKNGYTEMIPPFIVNSNSLVGTGNLPKFREDLFHLTETDYFLIPTAEVPVTNYFSGEILNQSDLPKMYCAYSPCFRSEAGSHGRDTKGLIRQHQFNKVELMIFSLPDKSYDLHEKLTLDAESILQDLELPFRRMLLCSGDIGFSSAKTYDLEVWLPGQNEYREISSCSNFEDFQARRANIRFREPGGKPQFVHTINGSGLAVGRTLIAILENYQKEDGSIEIPAALVPYFHGQREIRKR